MRKGLLGLVLAVFLLSGCAPTPTPVQVEPTPVPQIETSRVYANDFDTVWSVVVLVVAGSPWETEFIDKGAGVIKFRKSYVYGVFGRDFKRIYHWPLKHEVEFSFVDAYLQKFTTWEPALLPVTFTIETLVIRVKEISKDQTKVKVDWDVSAFHMIAGEIKVHSNGTMEQHFLDKFTAYGGGE